MTIRYDILSDLGSMSFYWCFENHSVRPENSELVGVNASNKP